MHPPAPPDKLPQLRPAWYNPFPRFADPALEQRYRIAHMRRHTPKAVRSIALALLLYPCVDLTFRLGQMQQPQVAHALYLYIEPLLLACLAIALLINRSLRDTWSERIQGVTLVLYLAIGLASVKFTMLFPDPQVVVAGHLLIAIVLFFGYLLVVLRPPWALLGSAIITVAYGLALLDRWPEAGPLARMMGLPPEVPHEFIAQGFMLLVINTCGLYTAWTIDQNERRVFWQQQVIEKQRDELDVERHKSEQLLLNILPETIATRLKSQPGSIADGFDNVAVLFADIVGFTPRAQSATPASVVAMLNEVFTTFDGIARRHGVEKIKTIGDAYMIAAGIPDPLPDSCDAIARCALDMMDAVRSMKDPGGQPLELRIGIHAGPVVAGVIGQHKFAYDLWGDTVNTASRMEAHGAAGRIQVTASVHRALVGRYRFEERGRIAVKGIGEMDCWYLLGPTGA